MCPDRGTSHPVEALAMDWTDGLLPAAEVLRSSSFCCGSKRPGLAAASPESSQHIFFPSTRVAWPCLPYQGHMIMSEELFTDGHVIARCRMAALFHERLRWLDHSAERRGFTSRRRNPRAGWRLSAQGRAVLAGERRAGAGECRDCNRRGEAGRHELAGWRRNLGNHAVLVDTRQTNHRAGALSRRGWQWTYRFPSFSL